MKKSRADYLTRVFVGALFLVILCYQTISIIKIISTTAPDFSVFYQSAVNLLHHKNLYTDQRLYTGFGYPPYTALLFIPLTYLPYQIAQGIWIVTNTILLALCACLSLKLIYNNISLTHFLLIYSLMWLSFPTKFTFGMGQVNILALFIMLLALVEGQVGKKVTEGIYLGLLFILKPHFLIFLPIYMIRKRWKTLSLSLGLLFITGLGAGLLFGWGQFYTYVTRTVPELLVFQGREIYYNQGIGAFLSRVQPIYLASMETTIASILFVAGSFWLIWKNQIPIKSAVIGFIPVFLLIEPLSWQHHYVFLLPVFVALVRELKGHNLGILVLGMSYLLISINIKQPQIYSDTLVGNIVLSHVFWGNLVLLFLLYGIHSRRHIFS